MKTRTLKSISLFGFGILITMPLWGRVVFSNKGLGPAGGTETVTKTCKEISNSDTKLDLKVYEVLLTYDASKYPYSAADFRQYHGDAIHMLSDLVTPQTELLGSRKSFIKVSIQGTECSGIVESQIDKAEQVRVNQITGFKAFPQNTGGNIKDVKLIANSIISFSNHERLVWTKVYSGVYLAYLEKWKGDDDNDHLSLTTRAAISYPYQDSLYLNDSEWVYRPIYNDGEFVVSGGGGGGTIDPSPGDSIMF